MKGFSGFPSGRLQFAAIPSLFFSDVLPHITDIAELKATLHCFWLATQQAGQTQAIALQDLLADDLLLQGLRTSERDGRDSLKYGLELAVARGTLLQATVHGSGDAQEWYFLNTEAGRQALESCRQGDWSLLGEQRAGGTMRLQEQRPNIFVLYEQNIGALTPLLAEELQEAERDYPAQWIEDALRIAVEQNVRRWRYVRAILERWRTEGREDEAAEPGDREDRYRYIRGKYGDYVQR